MNPLLVAGALALAPLAAAPWQDYPKAEIGNGLLRVEIYLPDAGKGYYRATRFDWSGVICRLEYQGHNYFSPWQPKHDPLVHNSICGPVDTFEANLGYEEAAPGGFFVRIGVGVLQKPEDPGFRPGMMSLYKVVDPGNWRIERGEAWIRFTQEIPALTGYAYRYVKEIRLERGRPEMVLSHELTNTGAKMIETTGFNHNFFVIDGQPSGPGFVLRVPFDPKVKLAPNSPLIVEGREFRFTRELAGQEAVMALVSGFGATAGDHEIVIENHVTGAAVRINGDRPLYDLRLFFRRPNVCPETFFHLRLEPKQTANWQARYSFYTVK